MYIEQLSLQDFRNYPRLDIAFPCGLLLFTGGNAQGKSNLLEAIYLLATTRSVRATGEGELVNWEAARQGPAVARLVGTARRHGAGTGFRAACPPPSDCALTASCAAHRRRWAR
jgi:recombinational DNA repair ATPase RecF